MTTASLNELPYPEDETARGGNHAPGRVRTCDTTGLPICLTAQHFIRLNAVLAVVCLLVGGVSGSPDICVGGKMVIISVPSSPVQYPTRCNRA